MTDIHSATILVRLLEIDDIYSLVHSQSPNETLDIASVFETFMFRGTIILSVPIGPKVNDGLVQARITKALRKADED